jgi:hypothetical protein
MARIARTPIVSAFLGAVLTCIVLTGAALAANTIRSIDIVNGAIGTADLRNGDVRSIDIRNGNVLAADIRAGAITSSKLAAGSVTAASLESASVMSVDIADGTITTADIADGAVTPAKLSSVEAWHTVGAAGEPAYENGWAAYPSTGVTFRKDRDGMVHLLGTTTKSVDLCSLPSTMFTLPTGYRPTLFFGFPVVTSSNPFGSDSYLSRITITNDGVVHLGPGAQCWMVFLGHISFPAA